MKLGDLRKRRAWTQAQLATEAGVSARTVYNVERGTAGEKGPQPRVMLAISKALGVEPAEVDEFRPWLGLAG